MQRQKHSEGGEMYGAESLTQSEVCNVAPGLAASTDSHRCCCQSELANTAPSCITRGHFPPQRTCEERLGVGGLEPAEPFQTRSSRLASDATFEDNDRSCNSRKHIINTLITNER